jgi:hypothetical protein
MDGNTIATMPPKGATSSRTAAGSSNPLDSNTMNPQEELATAQAEITQLWA